MRINTATGGNAVVAFVGPSVGSRRASQQIALTGTEPIALNNPGVVGSPVVTGKINRVTYVEGDDYTLTTIDDNYSTIARNVRTTSVAAEIPVSNQQFTYYSSEPVIELLVDSQGQSLDGHIIAGTVRIRGLDGGSGAVTYVEGTDYMIDYYANTFAPVAGGAFEDENDINLVADYWWTTAEPVELFGEVTFPLEHQFVSKDALTALTEYTNSDGERVASSYVHTLDIVSCRYSVEDDEGYVTYYDYGDTPGVTDPYGDTGYIGYIEGIDYVVDYETGKIARTANSRIPSFDEKIHNYMYVAYGYCAIKENQQLIVNYRYTNEEYYDAQYFTDFNAFADYFGDPWNADGTTQSPISVGAYIAARNGMSRCYGVAVPGTVDGTSDVTYTLDGWVRALDKLSVIDGIDIVVPLTGDKYVWEEVANHLSIMYENQDERVAILGTDGSEVPVSKEQMIDFAHGLGREDMWLVAPSSVNFRNPISGVVGAVPGYYMAAAVAGYNSSVPQYTPLTAKVVSGFFSAKEYANKSNKTEEVGNGLMYVDETGGALRILHGVSTNTESVLKRETNIVLTKYFIIKSMRRTFNNGYIGSIITPRMLLSIRSTVESILFTLQDNSYITSFDGIAVEQNELDPTQVDIQFAYVPMYGLNYIEIKFSVMTGLE